MKEIIDRLNIGRERYGHGVRVDDDTTTWGTKENSWMEMAREEFLDAVIYVIALIKSAPAIEPLAMQVADHDGVEFVPALTGLGAPHWAPDARGTFTGLTRGTERGHIARATLDAMALQNADILRAMQKDLGKRMKPLRVDGGAAANDLLMQIQADVLGRKLIRPQVIETTVAGACYLAGLGIGLWQGTGEVRSIWQAEREFSVGMSTNARRKRQSSWNSALQRTLL